MEAGGVPGRDPPDRVETLDESARTRVTRLHFSGRSVVRKEVLEPAGERPLQHELAMLERLRAVKTPQEVDSVRPFHVDGD